MTPEEPHIVKSQDIHIDTDYANWIAELKHRYRSAQVKAAVKVNVEKLLFNWQLGQDLVQKRAEERWGTGVVEQVSLDLKREFPDADGFSARNLQYMKQWYLFYNNEATKLQRLVAEFMSTEKDDTLLIKLQRPVAELIFSSESKDFPVATYNNIRIKDALPSQEQLTERVRLLQKELQETKRLMKKI